MTSILPPWCAAKASQQPQSQSKQRRILRASAARRAGRIKVTLAQPRKPGDSNVAR